MAKPANAQEFEQVAGIEYDHPPITPVKIGLKYGFINGTGKIVVPLIYEDARSFYNGVAMVSKNFTWGGIDKDGNTVIDFTYVGAMDFIEGVAMMKNSARKWGGVDINNEIVVPFKYDKAKNSKDGFIEVKQANAWKKIPNPTLN